MLSSVKPEIVSFVIQGPTAPSTAGVIDSVRNFFPSSEIILSTWRGADTKGLETDIIIESDDPGSLNYRLITRPDNINRQIVSTVAGLKAASRPFAVKLRTDCKLAHAGFLNLFDRYTQRREADRVYRDRIVCCTLFCRDPRFPTYLFHPSDVFQFGRLEDLRRAWDVPLRRNPDNEPKAALKAFNLRPYLSIESPLVPEQYLWTHVLAKSGHPVHLDHAGDWSIDLVNRSESLFVNNYVPFSAAELGIELPEHLSNPMLMPNWVYTHERWLELYRRDCETDKQPFDLRLVVDSFKAFFGYSYYRTWPRTRVLFGAFRRQLKQAIGFGHANP